MITAIIPSIHKTQSSVFLVSFFIFFYIIYFGLYIFKSYHLIVDNSILILVLFYIDFLLIPITRVFTYQIFKLMNLLIFDYLQGFCSYSVGAPENLLCLPGICPPSSTGIPENPVPYIEKCCSGYIGP